MAKKREPLSPEDLIEISKRGVNGLSDMMRADSYTLWGETDLLNWPRRQIQGTRCAELFCVIQRR